MTKVSELRQALVSARLETNATLNVMARHLLDAGRLTKAGRGVNCGRATTSDAARLLIVCGATERSSETIPAEALFSNLVCVTKPPRGHMLEGFLSAHSKPTLDLTLALVLSLIGSQAASSPRSLPIRMKPRSDQFSLQIDRSQNKAALTCVATTFMFEDQSGQPLPPRSGKQLRATIDAEILAAVAKLVAA